MRTPIEATTRTAPRRSRKKRIFAGIAIAAVVIGGSSAAFAYWTSGGAGTGYAISGAGLSNIKVVQVDAPAGVNPGVAGQSGSGTLDNTDAAAENGFVNSISATVDNVFTTATGTTPAVGCGPADYLVGDPVKVEKYILKNTDDVEWTGPTIAFNDSATVNQDGCKNMFPHMVYTLSSAVVD